MKFKINDKVKTLVSKGTIQKGSIGFVACDFSSPNEAYDIEFWNETDTKPYGYETYLVSELEKF